MILTMPRLISNVVELPSERVAQVDLVSQGVAELNAHKLSVPSSLHVLLSIAFRVGIGFKWELSPDGIFA